MYVYNIHAYYQIKTPFLLTKYIVHCKLLVYLVVQFVLVLFVPHQVTQSSFCSLPSKHDKLVTFGETHHDMTPVIQDL